MIRNWFIYLIAFPILEIYGLVLVGGYIGALNTVALVLLSGFAGVYVLRSKGSGILAAFQESTAQKRMPPNPIISTVCYMLAGWLFIIPGFISDIMALLLLFPPVQRWVAGKLRTKMQMQGFSSHTVYTQTGHMGADGAMKWTCSTVHSETSAPSEHDTSRDNGVIIDCSPTQIDDHDADGADSQEPKPPHSRHP